MSVSLMWLLDGIAALPRTEAQVADLAIDSREVRPGGLFLALCGRRSHGLKFAAEAAARGASAVLWAVRPQLSSRVAEPDFRSAIAFYPDCRVASGLGWSTRVPTLVLIGAKDDVSSPPACRQMIDGARGRSALARIVVYPSAYHDFDRANLPVHAVAATSDPAGPEHGHLGTDTEARADSQKRVAEWLAR